MKTRSVTDSGQSSLRHQQGVFTSAASMPQMLGHWMLYSEGTNKMHTYISGSLLKRENTTPTTPCIMVILITDSTDPNF